MVNNEELKSFKSVTKEIQEFLTAQTIKSFFVHDTLFRIEGQELVRLWSSLRTCNIPRQYHDYKDVLRKHITKVMDLGPNDVIFFTENSIYVKYFASIEMPKDGERRACGLDKEVLEEYKQEFFEGTKHRDIALEFAPSLIDDIISFKKINPLEFKKIFIPVFVNLFEIIVLEYTDIEDEKIIRGFSYYLLREVFDELMLSVAEDILFHYANQERKAVEFLSCFSVHERIDEKGVRYKPNPILDESNHAWNMTTIRSTMIQHKKAKQAVYDKKNALISIKEKLEKHYAAKEELEKEKESKEIEFEEIDQKIEGIHSTLDKLRESDSEEVRYEEDGVEHTYKRKPLIKRMFKKEDDYLSERHILKQVVNELNSRLSNKQKDIDIWEKKYAEDREALDSIEKKGHPTDKLYSAIKRALAKALTRR